jgi:hypothetical protein
VQATISALSWTRQLLLIDSRAIIASVRVFA